MNGFGQAYFNVAQTGTQTTTNILNVDKHYYSVTRIDDTLFGVSGVPQLWLYKMDNLGNTIKTIRHYSGPYNQYLGSNSNLNFKHNTFYQSALLLDSLGHNTIIIICFNSDLENRKQINIKSSFSQLGAYNHKLLVKDKHIVCGYIWNGTHANILLIKADSTGTVEWEKLYSPTVGNRQELARGVIACRDGGFAMICESWISSFDDLKKQSRTYLIKTDSLGNEEWRKTFKGKDQNSTVIGGEILLTPQNEILVAYGDGDGYYRSWSGAEARTKHNVTLKKFDLYGNLIQQKSICDFEATRSITSLTQYNDSTYALIGERKTWDTALYVNDYSDTINTASYVLGFNSDLDSLYHREFIFPYQRKSDVNRAFGISPTKDGGLVTAGYYLTDGTATGRAGFQAWYVKMDSIGCTYAGCDTVYNKPKPIDTTVAPPPEVVLRKVYPNPSSKKLYIETFQNKNEIAVLSTIHGQLIRKENLLETITEWDVSTLPNGVYIFSLLSNNKNVLTQKLIIQH